MPKPRRKPVTVKSRANNPFPRAEFDDLRRVVGDCCKQLEIQFKRIAQIQAELDKIKDAGQHAAGQPKVR